MKFTFATIMPLTSTGIPKIGDCAETCAMILSLPCWSSGGIAILIRDTAMRQTNDRSSVKTEVKTLRCSTE